MKLIILFLVFIAISCKNSNLCSSKKNYFKLVDTTKPYSLKGVYCLSGVQNSFLEPGYALVKINLYDRVTGRKLGDGVVWFFGQDTLRLRHDTSAIKIKPGKYIVEALEIDYDRTKTKAIDFKENKKTEINFYLGSTVVY